MKRVPTRWGSSSGVYWLTNPRQNTKGAVALNSRVIVWFASTILAAALAAGSGTTAMGQQIKCSEDCSHYCAPSYVTILDYDCSSCYYLYPPCSGGITYNEPGGAGPVLYPWYADKYKCCYICFCSVVSHGDPAQCEDEGRLRTNERPSVLSAAAWSVLVLDCSGRYKLVEPETSTPCGLPKEAGALRTGPAAMNRSKRGLLARASQQQGSSGR